MKIKAMDYCAVTQQHKAANGEKKKMPNMCVLLLGGCIDENLPV